MFAVATFLVTVILFPIAWSLVVYFRDVKNLRRFPAPSFACITNFWAANWVRHGKRSLEVHNAHQRLGPIVRIQPEHLSFNLPEAVQDIYGFSQHLLKDPFYDTFTGNEYASIVGTRSREDHGRKRKYVSNAFAQKNVVLMGPIIQRQISNLVAKLDRLCVSGESIDIRKYLNLFTFDVICLTTFGKEIGFVNQGNDRALAEARDGTTYWTNAIKSFHMNSFYDTFMAHWPATLKWTKGLTWWHAGNVGGADFTAVTTNLILERQKKGKPEGYTDFFHNLLVDRNGKGVGLSLDELEKEAGVLVNAGSDTTATAMTHCLYYLMKHPRVIAKLRAELDTALSPQGNVASYAQVKDLKYLRACVDEAMRLRPPTSLGLPRITPLGGAIIAGYSIAGGVTVSVPTYTLHRNPALFSNPEQFRPERWLEEEEGQVCRQYVIPFSAGPRACTGRNLSYLEQTMLIATLVHRYEWTLPCEGFVLKTIERFNANPDDFIVGVERRVVATT